MAAAVPAKIAATTASGDASAERTSTLVRTATPPIGVIADPALSGHANRDRSLAG